MIYEGKYPSMFEADLGDGQEVELCEGGANLEVTPENKDLFVKLYLQKYLEQDDLVYEALISGVQATCTKQMLGVLSARSGP